jgi:hypothetical protein
VNVHDFENKKLGKDVPYGVYDVTANTGFVSVGITSDTAEFAVKSIRCWLERMGRQRYPNARELTVTADCGGSPLYVQRSETSWIATPMPSSSPLLDNNSTSDCVTTAGRILRSSKRPVRLCTYRFSGSQSSRRMSLPNLHARPSPPFMCLEHCKRAAQ